MTATHDKVVLGTAVLTVSDSRDDNSDTSGHYLVGALAAAGHRLIEKCIVPDDRYRIRAVVSQWIAAADIDVILVTGGTGFGARDTTPEALTPLFDKLVAGFGELFRQLSFDEIGTSTLQSRALAGLANATIVFCLPGSTGACRTAWEGIIAQQIDSSHRPCNFVDVLRAGPAPA